MKTFSYFLAERQGGNITESFLSYLSKAKSRIIDMVKWGLGTPTLGESVTHDFYDDLWPRRSWFKTVPSANPNFVSWVEKKGFVIPKTPESRDGNVGRAYFDASNKFVVKLTQDLDEGEIATLVAQSGGIEGVAIRDVAFEHTKQAYVIFQDRVETPRFSAAIEEAVEVVTNYISQWGFSSHGLDHSATTWTQKPKTSKDVNDFVSNKNATQDALEMRKGYKDLPNYELAPYITALLAVIFRVFDKTGRLWHDIKTSNIGMDRQGRFMLFDLGYNKAFSLKQTQKRLEIL